MRPPARTLVWVCLLWTSCLPGCGDDVAIEQERPNLPPETTLTGGRPDSVCDIVYRVPLEWNGFDPDGSVRHFQVILIDHPAIDDPMACGPGDPMAWAPPAADDPRWAVTTGLDTVIVSSADTLRRDPRPPPGSDDGEVGDHNALVRMQSFERWHTFYVRAVDDRGAADPTPQHVSFNSTTLAPEVRLLPPVDPSAVEFEASPAVVFRWQGVDPVGDGSVIEPLAARWVMVPTARLPNGAYAGYPLALYDLPDGTAWSEWRLWNASDGSGREAALDSLAVVDGSPTRGYYLFAVQAMDEAGAVTPVFDATTPGQNNVARVVVRNSSFGPELSVDGGALGQHRFVGYSDPVRLDVATGQPIRFSWHADASYYGRTIDGYRWGWNIRNPANDEEWEQDWCLSEPRCLAAPTRIFNSGTQRFFLETRDDIGNTTHAEIELVVHQVVRRRDLLLVDDTQNFEGDPQDPERREDERWLAIAGALPGITFDPADDVYDVVSTLNQSPPMAVVFDYETIVWYAKVATGTTALTDIAAFFDPFAPDAGDQVPKFNYLNTYVDNGGEIWISGQQPTDRLWRFPEASAARPYPFNVTNWHQDTHPPGLDSLGVTSFLWRLGAEAVDLGGGGRGPAHRDNAQHYCTGFRRLVSPATMGAPDALDPDPLRWPSHPNGGRHSVEIYNMPAFLASQVPPLQPDPQIWLPAYEYASVTPANPGAGVVYPATADGQPAILLRKARATDANYSRALCGFEVWRLSAASHLALAQWILRDQFRLGQP